MAMSNLQALQLDGLGVEVVTGAAAETTLPTNGAGVTPKYVAVTVAGGASDSVSFVFGAAGVAAPTSATGFYMLARADMRIFKVGGADVCSHLALVGTPTIHISPLGNQ